MYKNKVFRTILSWMQSLILGGGAGVSGLVGLPQKLDLLPSLPT